MDIPARNYFRYLMLCGLDSRQIQHEFNRHLLLLPPDTSKYYREQTAWVGKTFGVGSFTIPTALRRAKLTDMWAAYKGHKTGKACKTAYVIATHLEFRKPAEAMLIAGYPDEEVVGAINKSLTHPYEISETSMEAFRKYFFDPSYLSASDRYYLASRSEWIKTGMLGLESDLLMHAMGLRYNTPKNLEIRARFRSLQKYLVTLESMPLRTDREGVKALSSLISSIKSLEKGDEQQDESVPLLQLLTEVNPNLEVI